MKHYLLFLTLLIFSSSFYAQNKTETLNAIEKAMHEQELAWNKGDITGFMGSYWNSDSLKFIGKNGVTFGWKNTLDNYMRNYPDKETMGTLNFALTSVEVLNDNTCFVIGSWSLAKKKGNVAGFYTLLWKKINGKWLITVDHTS